MPSSSFYFLDGIQFVKFILRLLYYLLLCNLFQRTLFFITTVCFSIAGAKVVL